MDTKMIDALFLELAQFTKAQTPQMVRDAARIKKLEDFIKKQRHKASLLSLSAETEEERTYYKDFTKDCEAILK